jgi:peptide/nickel transport system permease protein
LQIPLLRAADVTGYIARRLVALVPVLFFVSIVRFMVNLLLPGDPALAYIGETKINDKVMHQAVRQELGLDQPNPVQYVRWLGHALQGDFGHRSARASRRSKACWLGYP